MRTIDILVVEDNPGDIRLIERVFADRDLPGTLHVVQSGDEALNWLCPREEFTEAPRLNLVLLDLNLLATSGQAVLEELKSEPRLKRIPVIVLTGSHSERELLEAYEAHANAYLVKPVDPKEFADLIQTCAEFWVSTATLPPVSESAGDPQP